MERVWEHEQDLVAYTLPRLQNIPGLRLLGPAEAPERGGVFSFTIEGIHSHDLASFLNEEGIAIRGGHHCAQPLLQSLGLTECARLSVGITTSCEEIDTALFALRRSIAVLI
jgi:cysteine desulfurase/selenocysteine lyase